MFLLVNHSCPTPYDLTVSAHPPTLMLGRDVDTLGRTVPASLYVSDAHYTALTELANDTDAGRRFARVDLVVNMGSVNALGHFAIDKLAARDAALAPRKVL